MTGVLNKKKGRRDTQRRPCEDIRREEGHVTIEVEIGVMQLQGKKEYKGFPETTRSWERHGTDSFPEPPERTNSANTLISDCGLQNYKRVNFYCCRSPSLW